MRTLVFWLTLAVGACGTRAADLHLLQTDGPSWNRLNLVFFAEGYTHGQTDRFLQDCTNALWGNGFSAGLLNTDPFSRYAAGFNAYAVFVSSPQEGADRPALNPPVWVNTYFDATFGPTDWVLGLAASGRARLNTLLDAHFPTNAYPHRFPIVLVNTPYQDGGGANTNLLLAATGPTFLEIFVHESGHLLGGLGDEYDQGREGLEASLFGEAPNVTQETNRAQIKWREWIDETTPVPTPAGFGDVIGLFAGANYSATGWYRPRPDCRMRSLQPEVPFCEVCREALVRHIYSRLSWWDAVTPATNFWVLTNATPVVFAVTPIPWPTEIFTYRWSLDGVWFTNTPTPALSVVPTLLTSGLHTLELTVADVSDWLRPSADPEVSQTHRWQLSVSLPTLHFTRCGLTPEGRFWFELHGPDTAAFAIETSTNWQHWTPLLTNTLKAGSFGHTNTDVAGSARHFYRAKIR